MIRLCKRYDKLAMPGAFTPTEILAAWEAGADIVKVFPSDAVGPSYLKALKGPFPQIRLMPTGGVNLQTLPAFVKAGACAVGVGSSLVDPQAIREGKFDRLRELAGRLSAGVEVRPRGGMRSECASRGRLVERLGANRGRNLSANSPSFVPSSHCTFASSGLFDSADTTDGSTCVRGDSRRSRVGRLPPTERRRRIAPMQRAWTWLGMLALLAGGQILFAGDGGANPVFTNKVRFRIPFRSDAAEMQRLDAREVQLYVSTDQGTRWRMVDKVEPRSSTTSITWRPPTANTGSRSARSTASIGCIRRGTTSSRA